MAGTFCKQAPLMAFLRKTPTPSSTPAVYVVMKGPDSFCAFVYHQPLMHQILPFEIGEPISPSPYFAFRFWPQGRIIQTKVELKLSCVAPSQGMTGITEQVRPTNKHQTRFMHSKLCLASKNNVQNHQC
jgi:hypothetical protein